MSSPLISSRVAFPHPISDEVVRRAIRFGGDYDTALRYGADGSGTTGAKASVPDGAAMAILQRAGRSRWLIKYKAHYQSVAGRPELSRLPTGGFQARYLEKLTKKRTTLVGLRL